MNVMESLIVATAIACATMGGVFFAFSSFVMQALKRLPPAQGIAAMQSINIVAVTPVFMTALFGTAVACLVVAVVRRHRLARREQCVPARRQPDVCDRRDRGDDRLQRAVEQRAGGRRSGERRRACGSGRSTRESGRRGTTFARFLVCVAAWSLTMAC